MRSGAGRVHGRAVVLLDLSSLASFLRETKAIMEFAGTRWSGLPHQLALRRSKFRIAGPKCSFERSEHDYFRARGQTSMHPYALINAS